MDNIRRLKAISDLQKKRETQSPEQQKITNERIRLLSKELKQNGFFYEANTGSTSYGLSDKWLRENVLKSK